MSTEKVIVYGIHAVNALIHKRPHDILCLHTLKQSSNSRIKALLEQAEILGIESKKVDEFTALIDAQGLTQQIVHQGVIAIAKAKKVLTEKQLQHDCQQTMDRSLTKEASLWLVLDNIQDPQNLGAIIRHAESCGCQGIIAPNHHSAPLNQTVRKIASGAAELINFYQVSNLARAITHLKQAGIWTIGLDAEHAHNHSKSIKQNPLAQNLFMLDLSGHVAFVLGAESTGLRQKTKQYCDQLAYLPMLGQTQSLNVSHATTVTLFECIRQRYY